MISAICDIIEEPRALLASDEPEEKDFTVESEKACSHTQEILRDGVKSAITALFQLFRSDYSHNHCHYLRRPQPKWSYRPFPQELLSECSWYFVH